MRPCARGLPPFLTRVLVLLSVLTSGLPGCSSDDPVSPGGQERPPVPAAVADLRVSAATPSSVTLAWTAPAAQEKAAGELRYDIRHLPLGQESADPEDWDTAPSPVLVAAAGQTQSVLVGGLEANTTYVFTVSASYDGSAWSPACAPVVATAAVAWDQTPPARVTDLRQFYGSPTSVMVAWTPAGDDSIYGRAQGQELRYSLEPLTAENWESADLVLNDPVPHSTADKLVVEIGGLVAHRTYHVGLLAWDDAGHTSALSNVAQVLADTMRTLYVNVEGTGDYPSIEEAIHAARPNDVVLVGPGRYTWTNQGTGDPGFGLINVERDQTDFTVVSEKGALLTILDAERNGPVMSVTGGTEGQGEEREWAGITVDGFTFTNGLAVGEEAVPGEAYAGAGIVIHLSDTVVRNCIFTDNEAKQGGAIWSGGQGATVFENCLIENNRAQLGGGIMLVNSEPVITIRGCTIRNNTAQDAGGGLFAFNVGMVFEDNLVYGNYSSDKGGGISVSTLHEGCVVAGSTVAGNSAPLGSGFRIVEDTILEITGCLIAGNLKGAAFSTASYGGAAMGCNLVFGNAGGDGLPFLLTDLGGNISLDPLLCADGISPGPDSPCLPQNREVPDGCGVIGALGGGCAR